jgi:hypothetical protein
MRIMVTEDEIGAADDARAALTAAGHQVVGCQQHGSSALCGVLDEVSTCPLDQGPVDVTLAVRQGDAELHTSEHGVVCSLRQRVPLAVIGNADHLAGLGTEVRGPVAEACERVANGRQRGHEAVIRRALWATPQLTGVPGDQVSAVVYRHHDQLSVSVRVPSSVSRSHTAVLADRAARAVRSYDPAARQIDVAVVPTGEGAPEVADLLN